MSDGEHVVDDFEAHVACGVVDSGDIADLGVLCSSVVLEEGEDGNDGSGWDIDGELVLPDTELLDVFR